MLSDRSRAPPPYTSPGALRRSRLVGPALHPGQRGAVGGVMHFDDPDARRLTMRGLIRGAIVAATKDVSALERAERVDQRVGVPGSTFGGHWLCSPGSPKPGRISGSGSG